MSETSESRKSSTGDTGFFTVGQPLHPVRGGYVRRAADDELFAAVSAGRYAHVIAPGHTGKSSLLAAVAARLRNNGYKVANLDLEQIGERDGGTDAGRWYYSIAYRLLRQLRLKVDLQDWWQDKALLSNRQRLVEFYSEVILQNVREPVVVFVDKIQYVEQLPFKEHLLPSIRAAHNARSTDPEFERLSFVLSGEGDTATLVDDDSLSPFAVAQSITLSNFSRDEIELFAAELNLPRAEARRVLDRVWHWTAGQPYLTQKLCRALSRDGIDGDIDEAVDRVVTQLLAGRAALHSEPHLLHVHRRITGDRRDRESMLNTYGRLRKGLPVIYDPAQRAHRKLLASGLVQQTDDGDLAVANRVYETVFSARWANRNLPLHWRGPALVAAALLVVLALPFAYTELLPKSYTRVLLAPQTELASLADTWRSLRSFPGHASNADRLYRNALRERAATAVSAADIEALAVLAERVPDAEGFADNLRAGYWDRQARAALAAENRDGALLAALESLVVATPERRRRAAMLVADDYPLLQASLPPQGGERYLFSGRDLLLSNVSGAEIRQWQLIDGELQAKSPWTVSSLEVTPLLRRIAVDREGVVNRIALRINVSHARLADLRVKLIAPSGRTIELEFPRPASTSIDEIVFPAEALTGLRGESLTGTWTLSLRDEIPEVRGHLVGWTLSLNSQALVESFDRGMDIPAPVERPSDDLWFSADGRFAVARAAQSDSARLWHLASGRPARTLPIPASERVLGVSAEGRFVVTEAQGSVHLWRTVNGRLEAVLDARLAGAVAELTADGEHLLVTRRGEPETFFDLWSLDRKARIGELSTAGTPALLTASADGSRLAIADYDRAVRVWDLLTGQQLAQFSLHAQPSELALSADGATLALVHGQQGVTAWRADDPGEPLLLEHGTDRWQLQFSPGGDRFIAGSARRGYRVYRSSDGALLGPTLDPGFDNAVPALLGFGADDGVVLMARTDRTSRFWRQAADELPVPTPAPGDDGHRVWRAAGDSPAAIAPGGARIAVGDRGGHVHVLSANATPSEFASAGDALSYLGHAAAVTELSFSPDGRQVASIAADGSLRVWETDSGLPRPYSVELGSPQLSALAFSADGGLLALLTGQRLLLVQTADGLIRADLDLPGLHTALAFGADDTLYVADTRGLLRRLRPDRLGIYRFADLRQHERPVTRLAVSFERPLLVIVDVDNVATLIDVESGQVGSLRARLPSAVDEVLLPPGDSRVLFRTAGWIHRADLVAPPQAGGRRIGGIVLERSLRVPRYGSGARMALDGLPDGRLDPQASRVLLLGRDGGSGRVIEASFSFDVGTPLFGSRDELLADWRQRLGVAAGD